MKEQTTILLDSMLIPDNGRVLMLDDRLLVSDNLGILFTQFSPNDISEWSSRFPLKPITTTMIIVVKGAVKISINFRDYDVTDNTCAIIPSDTILQGINHIDNAQVIVLSFMDDYLPELAATLQNVINHIGAQPLMLLSLQAEHAQALMNCYAILRTILSQPTFACGNEAVAAKCVELMASLILQNGCQKTVQVSKTTRQDEIVAHFLESVSQNYRLHREISFYASQLGLSLKYMSHIVHEQTGRHPSAWIRDYVILDAKAMLHSGRYTVQQVSSELNFPNQSFFGKYFKEAVGISPKKWK
ncbi:MAG: AraC family transcriptional regulator [Muribaculaceae bacterium]|nr:AraC family transcriptional regulator [Muribaculaceae bacterium]